MQHRNVLIISCLALILLGTSAPILVDVSAEQLKHPISDLQLKSPQVILQYNATIPKWMNTRVTIDGNITANEYEGTFHETQTDIMVHWEHNGVNLSVGLVSPGFGWVALRVGETIDQSNMIFGGFKGNPYCSDLYGEGQNYIVDSAKLIDEETQQRGTDDIILFSGSENSTHTILEFIVPLNTGDPIDEVLEEGKTYSMYFAYHDTEDTLTLPLAQSEIIPIFISPEVVSPPGPELFEIDLISEYQRDQNVGNNISYGIKCINHFENETLHNVSIIEDMDAHKEYVEVINASSTLPETEAEVNYTKTKITCIVSEFAPKTEFWLWIHLSLIETKAGTLTLGAVNVTFVFTNGTEAFGTSNELRFTITKVSETSVTNALPTAEVLIPIFENFDNDVLISGLVIAIPLIFLFFTALVLSRKQKS